MSWLVPFCPDAGCNPTIISSPTVIAASTIRCGKRTKHAVVDKFRPPSVTNFLVPGEANKIAISSLWCQERKWMRLKQSPFLLELGNPKAARRIFLSLCATWVRRWSQSQQDSARSRSCKKKGECLPMSSSSAGSCPEPDWGLTFRGSYPMVHRRPVFGTKPLLDTFNLRNSPSRSKRSRDNLRVLITPSHNPTSLRREEIGDRMDRLSLEQAQGAPWRITGQPEFMVRHLVESEK